MSALQLPPVRAAYFLGIGGIGMSALARHALALGWEVGGYDKTPTPLTDALVAEGVWFTTDDTVDSIPPQFTTPGEVLVVWTPAIPTNHPQRVHFSEGGFAFHKRAEVLAAWANDGLCVAVGGTHGKTTTSSLLAWILFQAGTGARAFLGGIATNFGSNRVAGTGPITVVEADEFDRSFLHLRPRVALITSTDADHLDIYGTAEGARLAFEAFAALTLDHDGTLLEAMGLNLGGIAYGVDAPDAAYSASNLRTEDGYQVFDLRLETVEILGVRAGLPGRHNIENAVGAAAAAHLLGVGAKDICAAIASFRGVARRFDVRVRTDATVYIDDYAHHPTELRAALRAARQLHPNRPLTALFQPHLFTRTRDFLPEFAEALQEADTVVLLPIYPARELPLPGITSEALAAAFPEEKRPQVMSPQEAVEWVLRTHPSLLMTLGAGDIDRLVPVFEAHFTQHSQR
jgi:UDP-N-acetylmuramate--alanine ligase